MGFVEKKRAEMSNELTALLAANERVIMFGGCTARVDRLGATVTRQATAFVTDRRFGVLSKKIGGRDLVEIPLSLISTVEYDRNITAAQMEVGGAGITIKLERMQVNGAKEFVKVIREQIAEAKAQVNVVSEASRPNESIATQLSELAKLQAQGILSAEEFVAAKSKLLKG
jgi:hypothetical protein